MFTREQEYITRLGTTVSVLVGYANLERDTITFVMDITERKKAETVALEAVKTKSFFIANISHGISLFFLFFFYFNFVINTFCLFYY